MNDQAVTLADLTPRDLAAIQQGDGSLNEETHRRLAIIVAAAPECAAKLEQLQQLAADANSGENLELAYEMNRRFDLLLEAEGEELPGEVLEIEHLEDMRYPDLIAIANARIGRAEDPSHLLNLKQRLLRAEATEFSQQLEEFVQWLVLLSPEGVGAVLRQAGEMYTARTDQAVALESGEKKTNAKP